MKANNEEAPRFTSEGGMCSSIITCHTSAQANDSFPLPHEKTKRLEVSRSAVGSVGNSFLFSLKSLHFEGCKHQMTA